MNPLYDGLPVEMFIMHRHKQEESIDKIDIIKCKVQSDFIISVKFNLLQGFIIRNKEQKKHSDYLNIFALNMFEFFTLILDH